MALADFSVKKPVTIIMIFLGVVLFGLISYGRLPQELYPPITYPQLSVVTFYKDAAPEEMEILITKPIEEAVGTVSGVRRISSTSKEETSLVVAEFGWGTNMDFAALGIREKIDLIKESLPRGSEDPIVIKYNPFELPLMILNITAEKTPQAELTNIAKKIIKNEIEKAEGVAACNIVGGLLPEILVEIDQDRMMSKNIGINKTVEAISRANLNYPAGTIEESFYEYLIRTIGEFKVPAEISEVVVDVDEKQKPSDFGEFGQEDLKEKQARQVYEARFIQLKDIASVKETYKEKTSVSRYDGKDNISITVQKQADANTLRVAGNVKKSVEQIKKMLPKDVHVDIIYDQSAFVRSAISDVRNNALWGGILAFLVLWFFLRSASSSAIIALNIPVSIMAVFSLMYLSGLTLNMISLGGLALGVGMLVDTGIVVIENVYRYRQEEKKQAQEASILGTNEVSGALMGSTLTTVAVFLPMIFVIGIAGQIFKELAFTITFSLMVSWIAALTIIPVLSTWVRRVPDVSVEGKENICDIFLLRLNNFLNKILTFFLAHKILCVIAVFLIFIVACALMPLLDTEFLPKVDQGQFMIKLGLPPGTKLEYTDTIARRIESYLAQINEVQDVTVNIGSTKEKKGTALLETMGPHQGQIIINLKKRRAISTSAVLQRLKSTLSPKELGGAEVEYLMQDNVFKSAFQTNAPIAIEIKGQDLDKLRRISTEIEEKLGKIKGLYSIKDTFVEPAPEVKVNIFKEKAATYNLSTTDIAVSAQAALKGVVMTKFKKEGEEIDIRACVREEDRNDISKVRNLPLVSPLGISVPLAEVAYFNVGKGPNEINRLNQQRVVVVTANTYKVSFKDISGKIDGILKGLKLPSGYSAEFTGEREQIGESFNSLRLALILSLALVFMIMASEFESLAQPFIIMFTVPLSLIGVIFMLLATNTPLSVMVVLGFIVLGGIVVNNAIVLIDYVNILRNQGIGLYEAVILSSKRRLRPILMTVLTTMVGLIPLALGLGEGAKLQQPMAITVIGGLFVSTFLTLVFIPALYVGFEEMLASVRRRFFGVEKAEVRGQRAEVREQMAEAREQRAEVREQKTEVREQRAEVRVEEVKVVKEEEPPMPMPEEAPIQEEEPEPPAELLAPTEEQKSEVRGQKAEVKKKKESEQGKIPQDIWDLLTQRHKDLIAYLKQNKKITRKEYSDKFNVSIPTAARDLKLLSDNGLLIAKGPAAVGRYYVLKESV